MTGFRRLAALWLPVLGYGGVVFYLSSRPQTSLANLAPDYVIHPLEYVGLTVLVIRALNGGLLRPIPGRAHVLAVVLSALYAVSDEIHQVGVPRRTASVKDVLSDTLGAVVAIGAAEAIQRFLARRAGIPLAVVLYSRDDCHLCHEARDLLRQLSEELPLEWSEVDVGTDPELERRYGAEVPVIVARGTKVSKLAPDVRVIRRRLSRMASRPS